jgi:hypothetical protein
MKPVRLSLSGAGFLGAWHLGVSEALLRAGVLENGSLQVAGASAGAIVGAVIVAGVPLQQARLALSALAMEARSQPLGLVTPGYSLVDGVRKHLDEHLPLDAHQRASGRLHVALTSLRPGEVGALYHKCTFGSRDEIPLAFKIGGIVSRVLVDEGATVQRGQLLASLGRQGRIGGGHLQIETTRLRIGTGRGDAGLRVVFGEQGQQRIERQQGFGRRLVRGWGLQRIQLTLLASLLNRL